MAFDDKNPDAGSKQDEGGDVAAGIPYDVPLNADPAKNTEAGDTLSAINKTSGAADLLAKNAGVVSALTPKPSEFAQMPSGALSTPAKASPTNEAQPFGDIRPGSMADKMHMAITKAFSDPASQKPGGGTAALFAGVMGALSGSTPWDDIQKDTTATKPTQGAPAPKKELGAPIWNALADASGGGGLMGFAKRSGERTRQENEDRRVMATANAQMLHEQALTHKMGEDAINESIKTSTAAMNNAITPVPGAPPEAAGHLEFEGKTSDDLRALLASGEFKPSEQTAFATGRRMTGQDANGQPMYRTTYSVITPAREVEITPANAKYMDAQLGTSYSKAENAGMRLSGVQYLGQMQRAQSVEAANKAVQMTLKENSIKEAHINAEYTGTNIATAPGGKDVVNALNAHMTPTADGGLNPYAGVQAYDELKKRGFYNDPKNGISDEAARVYFGGGDEKHFKTMQENYAKAQEKAQENVDKTLTRAFAAEHPEGAAAASNAELTKLNTQLSQQTAIANSKDPAVTPEQKTDALNKVAQIQSRTAFVQDVLNVAKGTITGQEEKKKAEADAAEAAKGIDLEKLPDSELMNKILNYQIDPEKMAGIRGNQREKFMEKVAEEAKRRGVDWSEAEYKQRYQTVEDFRPGGQYGKQIIALNTFAKHAGMAALDHIDSLYNTNYKLWNKPINAVKEAIGAAQYAKMRTDLGVAKKEYLNFLNAGHAETEEDRKFAERLMDENSAPSVIKGVLEEMAATVQARAESMNQQYKATMQHGNFPHMFDQRSAQYLRRLGMDLSEAGDVVGENQPQKQSGKISVQIPGRNAPMMFDTQAQADAFKKEAGIQ